MHSRFADSKRAISLSLLLSISLVACRGAPRDTPVTAGPEPPLPGTTQTASKSPPIASAAQAAPAATVEPVATPPEEVRVDELPAEEAFVVRGSKAKGYGVLFGGICARPEGYADAIKIAASKRVQLVALRGDKPCSGEYRGWKFDLAGLSRRIDRTFLALGLGEPRDVLLIGYSQGASVAELLASQEPEKYTRFVLIAKPGKPQPWHFKKATAVATMAGTKDVQGVMSQGSRVLSAAGVKSRYFPLPGAAHGYMGDDPEGTFEKVFAWMYDTPPASPTPAPGPAPAR